MGSGGYGRSGCRLPSSTCTIPQRKIATKFKSRKFWHKLAALGALSTRMMVLMMVTSRGIIRLPSSDSQSRSANQYECSSDEDDAIAAVA